MAELDFTPFLKKWLLYYPKKKNSNYRSISLKLFMFCFSFFVLEWAWVASESSKFLVSSQDEVNLPIGTWPSWKMQQSFPGALWSFTKISPSRTPDSAKRRTTENLFRVDISKRQSRNYLIIIHYLSTLRRTTFLIAKIRPGIRHCTSVISCLTV